MDADRFIRELLGISRSSRPIFSFGRNAGSLFVSIGERSLWVAEVIHEAEGAPRGRLAEFIYPDDCKLEDAERMGAELASFLALRSFSARRVVFGVPAKWLIVRPYEMPPADEETASNVLWLHATERIMPALGPMVFDFLGECSTTEPTTLLLIGLQQRWMELITTLAGEAGLKVVGVTPIGVAVGATACPHAPSPLIALFGPGGLELIDQEGQRTRSIHYVRSNGSPQPVIAQLRRATAALSVDNDSPDRLPKDLLLWDDTGLEPQYLEALRDGTGLRITEVQRQWTGISESSPLQGSRGLSALALALCGNGAARLPVDFLNPRLSAPQRERGKPIVWLRWTVAAVALIFVLAFADLIRIQNQVSGLDGQLQSMQPALDVARPYVQSMEFADSFRATKPRYLACIADLTQALPPDGQTFLTSFNLHTDMNGEISGKSTNEQNVLDFRDKLNATGRFGELICKLDERQARGAGSGVSFSLTFAYLLPK